MTTQEKYLNLIDYIKKFDKLAVAFSGGVDSSFLLKVAHNTIGPNAFAITYVSPLLPKREYEFTKKYCMKNCIEQKIVLGGPESLTDICDNPEDRCYICKKNIFTSLLSESHDAVLFDGSNFDDKDDYRPGLKALSELRILSPLADCKLTKEDIRILSKELKIPTHDKASFSCLATRVPHGEELTVTKLKKIDMLEQFLYENSFVQFRVRLFGNTAKIEVLKEEIARLKEESMYNELVKYFNKNEVKDIVIDSKGYIMGNMNKVKEKTE